MSDDERLAPVIPLFGGAAPGRARKADDRTKSRQGHLAEQSDDEPSGTPGPAHPARRAASRPVPVGVHVARTHAPTAGWDDSGSVDEEGLRNVLVRKLRSKQLSSAEARTLLRGSGASEAQISNLVDEFEERRYLDDQTLADHIVRAGIERKGQGRVVIGRTLRQRGIASELIDQALAAVEDDDFEHALAFAEGKARSLIRYDDETALRRLTGQLARRGYSGQISRNAATRALREARHAAGGGGVGVRFVDSD
nr:regulatory protein RecX [Microbacterium pseudoresistens]